MRFVVSVRPFNCPFACNNLAPTDGFSLNLIFENFLKICREKSIFIKIGQEYHVRYMKT